MNKLISWVAVSTDKPTPAKASAVSILLINCLRALKPFKKEIKYFLQLLYYVFKEKSFDKANSYIQLIKSDMKNFPNFIEDYIEKTFLSNYKSYLYYLEKPYKNKLDNTNNKTEGYFRATMPKG